MPKPKALARPFEAPQEATPLTTRPAWIFLRAITGVGVLLALVLNSHAFWPSPLPIVSMVALAVLAAIASSFVTYRTVEGLTEDASLAMPINFAMLLLLDWHWFVCAIVFGEFLIFISEASRKVSPTIWYIRTFNPCAQIVSGAGAVAVLHVLEPIERARLGGVWLSIAPTLVLFLAALVWKILHNVQDSTLITLAAKRPLSKVHVPLRVFLSQFALFLIAIPFARLFMDNVWLSLFALAPLGVAYRLLGIPELEYRAVTDERTGLRNAGAFDRILAEAVDEAAHSEKTLVLLAIDIDHFKSVNDTYGHLAGDDVIANFAAILSDMIRYGDVAARTGGEEFALLLPEGDRAAGVAFAERLRQRVEGQRFDIEGTSAPLQVTVSIGVAEYPEDGTTATDICRAADAALYRAKREGRNAVRAA